MTPVIYDNCYTCWNGCPTDSRNQRGSVNRFRADTDGSGLTCRPIVADVDIVIAGGEIEPGVAT